jgi:chitin disaccharide deacetylase
MRYLIVNGDDFGASRGVNRGILEAHRRGILTSASLMVNMPGSEEAAHLAREAPELSVGVHVNFTNEGGEPVVDLEDVPACRAELGRQLERFRELLGRAPTHLDSHHNVHRRPGLRPLFVEAARCHALPLREHSPARYFSSFYGQWGGETHLEQVGPDTLQRILRSEIGDGVTELACHPGYVDPDFASVYSVEREAELRTLCDPTVRGLLGELGLRLIGFAELARVAGGAPG